MVRQPVRLALLVGAIVAAASAPARADHHGDCPTPAPAMRTIQVTECVPEMYKVKRTVHRIECRTEEYDAVKCVMVPETRTKEVCEVRCVPVIKTERRKVCKTVTCFEDRVVCKKEWRTVTETVMRKKLVRLGHWECYEAPAHFANLFNKCRVDPCDPCAPQCCPPKTRTKKRWVHCPVYECCPKTVCKRVRVDVPTVCKVPVCKKVWEECDVQVCHFDRVTTTRQVTYTVCVPKQVAYKATRTVRECVPHEEEVTCCRMVARVVERQVPDCPPACPAPCCVPCCESKKPGLFSRRNGRCCR